MPVVDRSVLQGVPGPGGGSLIVSGSVSSSHAANICATTACASQPVNGRLSERGLSISGMYIQGNTAIYQYCGMRRSTCEWSFSMDYHPEAHPEGPAVSACSATILTNNNQSLLLTNTPVFIAQIHRFVFSVKSQDTKSVICCQKLHFLYKMH